MKENCIILVDTSECMRNGDYIPSRMESQQDAVNLIVQGKIQSNPETTVGILTMSGKNPTVQIALSNNLSKLLSTTSSFRVEGTYVKFSKALKTGKLALKHRSTEGTARRRMIVFVGSPIYETMEELEQLAETLKKSNIYVDLVHFGCTTTEEKDFFIQKPFLSDLNTTANFTIAEEIEKDSKKFSTHQKLEAFINKLNEQQANENEKNNHFLYVAPNTELISTKIVSSGIMEEAAAGAAFAGAGLPSSEEEQIQMALRLSMMEADRSRMQQMQPPTPAVGKDQKPTVSQPAQVQHIAPQPMEEEEEEFDEEAMVQRAIQISILEAQEKERKKVEEKKPQSQKPEAPSSASSSATTQQTKKPEQEKMEPLGDIEMPQDEEELGEEEGEEEDIDEEAEIAKALLLSRMEAKKGKEKMEEEKEGDDEELEQLRLAKELSKQEQDKSKSKDEKMEDVLDDEAYLEQIAKSIKKKDEENKKK